MFCTQPLPGNTGSHRVSSGKGPVRVPSNEKDATCSQMTKGELFEAWSSVAIPDGLIFVSAPPRRWRKAQGKREPHLAQEDETRQPVGTPALEPAPLTEFLINNEARYK
ncbi:hypothetical protein DPX16_16433 [Anabarilius grahami]|uniref:Uncharacterized protein n=1 Tax=Anabarilius grahami TaxID=495550 RepID=A0A3N0XY10_ANAGA|nr:hypothetical protein DPX16_16433 [Anabarilius grahami]